MSKWMHCTYYKTIFHCLIMNRPVLEKLLSDTNSSWVLAECNSKPCVLTFPLSASQKYRRLQPLATVEALLTVHRNIFRWKKFRGPFWRYTCFRSKILISITFNLCLYNNVDVNKAERFQTLITCVFIALLETS